MADMKQFIKGADPEKIQRAVEIQTAYDNGHISKDEALKRLREEVKAMTPQDIAMAEQQLKDCHLEIIGDKKKIQDMIALFEEILVKNEETLPKEHPIARYLAENAILKKILLEIEDLVQYPVIKNQWFALYDRLARFRIHLSRKQNQLYPALEKKGFDRPTVIMWTLDDYVRDSIKEARSLLENGKEEAFIEKQTELVADIRDLLNKEESILYPTSLQLLTEEDFAYMGSGDAEIGFAWIDVSADDQKRETEKGHTTGASLLSDGDFGKDLAKLLGKYGFSSREKEELEVSTGHLSLEQINLIFKHLPFDISFVDENELVKFYSDTAHRIFPRSKNVIGRDVKNCHPRSSVHLVEEIIQKFKNKEEDSVDFWINKEGTFIYIYYAAVRDEEGNFRGVLEIMQDAYRIRNLEGSRTLLKWSKDAAGDAPKDKKDVPADKENKTTKSYREEQAMEGFTIQPNTKLAAVLERYPSIKEEIIRIHPNYKMLDSPLAKVMLPVATLEMVSQRGEMPVEDLIAKLKDIIAKKEGSE